MAEYCTLAELKDLGFKPEAFIEVSAPRRHQAVATSSSRIDDYIGGRFVLPLITWPSSLTRACAILASIDLIRNRGVSPEDAETLDAQETEIIRWLEKIASGAIPALQVTDSSPGATAGAPALRPVVVSSSSRGLSVRGTGLRRGPFQGD